MRIRVMLLGALAVALGVPACSGGDGGGGGGGGGLCPELQSGGSLTTGTYVGSCWDQIVDECAVLSTRNGDQFDVTVNGTSLQIGFGSGVSIGSGFTLSVTDEIDFTEDPFGFGPVDCVVETTQSFVGESKVGGFADVLETQAVTPTSGADCDLAAEGVSELAGETITLPCESQAEFRMGLTPP